MKAILQFEKYKVIKLQYYNNLRDLEEEELNPKFSVNIGINKGNPNQAVVQLAVEIGAENSKEQLQAEIAGFFRLSSEEEVQEDVKLNYFKINGTAILFPYLRSLVSDITSKGDDSPIILPTINIYSLFEDEQD